MKPLGFKNYGSIPHLSTSKLGPGDYYIEPGQEKILTLSPRDKKDKIFVFEKYDGSNVGIAKINGKIVPLTRRGYEAKSSPYKQHHLFAEWVSQKEKAFKEMLSENERIVGEWMIQAHGLKYVIEGDPIVFFDIFNKENKRFACAYTRSTVRNFEFKNARMLYKGSSILPESLLHILNQKTWHLKSEEDPEGMIYRVERNDKVDFLAKWVRPDFENGKYCINVDERNLTWNKII